MIGEDLDRVSGSLHIDPPLCEPLDHGEEFFIVDRIVELGCCDFFGVEADGVEHTSSGRLGKDAAEGEVRSIRVDGEGELGLKMLKDGSRSEGGLELAEGSLCLCRPGKFDNLPSQSSKGSSEGRIVKNELAIEVSKSQK